MSRLNWKRLLSDRNIPFVETGRDNIAVACPFCGAADPSQHLAISLKGRGWRCLRNPTQHRGKSYVRLLTRLLRITDDAAKELLGLENQPLPSEDQFSDSWRRQLGVSPSGVSARPRTVSLPREVKSLADSGSPWVGAFRRYLAGRGYTQDQVDWAIKSYDLHYSVVGDYAWRVVIPIYDAREHLATWTARSIKPDEKIRYKTHPSEQAVAPPSDLLLGLPLLWRETTQPRCLVVCEGPFDAITVSCLGAEAGVWGTCLFGVAVSQAQSELLEALNQRFDRVRLLVDPDARLKVLAFKARLPRGCGITNLLPGVKDPGDLAKCKQGVEFVRGLAV